MAKRARKTAMQPTTRKVSAARRLSSALAPSRDLAALVKRAVAIIEEACRRHQEFIIDQELLLPSVTKSAFTARTR